MGADQHEIRRCAGRVLAVEAAYHSSSAALLSGSDHCLDFGAGTVPHLFVPHLFMPHSSIVAVSGIDSAVVVFPAVASGAPGELCVFCPWAFVQKHTYAACILFPPLIAFRCIHLQWILITNGTDFASVISAHSFVVFRG